MQTVEQALADMTLYSDDTAYVFVKLPARAITLAAGLIAEVGSPFSALIIDKDEVSIMIVDEAIEEFAERLFDFSVSAEKYRLITFDIALDLSMVGFMAKISTALAKANVSIMTYAAYTRDHILVTEKQFDIAMKTLQDLQKELKSK
ncbi:MAG: ACT domain-containing protein [Aggregatilineales bacterium]